MNQKSWLSDLFFLTLGIGILFFFLLGCRALSVPDEARYTEIPREMLFFHDFITPHLDGVKYFEKPPLLYWIQAGVIHFFGIREFFLRLPTAIFALLGCLGTYVTGRLCFDRATGILSAAILATSPLYFAMAHSITLDMTLTCWMTLGLFAFLIAVDLPHDASARRYTACLMFVCAALAVLTKGLVGILLPGMIIFSWLLIFNRWKELLSLSIPSGLVIFLLMVLPWHILVQMKNPEFFHFYFIDQQFTRYLTKAAGRYQPFWWFIPILLAGLFPWVCFLFQALRDAISVSGKTGPAAAAPRCVSRSKGFAEAIPVFAASPYQKQIFLVLWAVEIFVFFSLSNSKLIPYILPVFPPLALLIGHYLAEFKKIKIWYFIAQALFLWGIVIAFPYFDLRPIKPLALQINTLAKPGDIIASYGLYYQDLPVYTKRIVLIVDWKNELSFGYNHQDSAKDILIDTGKFWQLWAGPTRVFAVMDEDDYQRNKNAHRLYVLNQHDDDFLVSNQA